MLAIDQEQPTRGAHLLGAWEKLRASVFVADLYPFIVSERESHIAAARQQLGDEVFNRAWAEGKAMTKEEALKYAVEMQK